MLSVMRIADLVCIEYEADSWDECKDVDDGAAEVQEHQQYTN